MKRHHCLGLLAALLLSACAPGAGGDPCAVEKLAELPVTMVNGLPRVSVAINGKPANLLLDTGAGILTLTAAAAKRLDVAEDPTLRFTSSGVGGHSFGRALQVRSLDLGGEAVTNQLAAELGYNLDGFGGTPLDGILGNSVLHRFDLELDSPGGRVAFYRARFCPAGAIPWTDRHVVLRRPTSARSSQYSVIPVQIDGQNVIGLLDTGASSTVIDIAVARRLGVDPALLTPERGFPAQGVAESKGVIWRHRFRSISVAGQFHRDPELGIVDLGTTAEMLVGQNVLRGRKLWVSFGSDLVALSEPRPPSAPAPPVPATPLTTPAARPRT